MRRSHDDPYSSPEDKDRIFLENRKSLQHRWVRKWELMWDEQCVLDILLQSLDLKKLTKTVLS
jgi:hypothetical protein